MAARYAPLFYFKSYMQKKRGKTFEIVKKNDLIYSFSTGLTRKSSKIDGRDDNQLDLICFGDNFLIKFLSHTFRKCCASELYVLIISILSMYVWLFSAVHEWHLIEQTNGKMKYLYSVRMCALGCRRISTNDNQHCETRKPYFETELKSTFTILLRSATIRRISFPVDTEQNGLHSL